MIPSQLQWLANHLWQSTLFAVVAGLLTLTLRKNRAQARYWIWLAASVKFLIPFSLLVAVGSHWGRRSPPAITPPVASYVIEQASQPFSAPPLVTTTAAPASSLINWLPAVLPTVWAIGFATLICFWWRRWRGLRAALRTASPLDLQIGMDAMISPAFAEPGVFGVRRPVLLLPAGITDRLTPPQLKAIVAHELCHIRRRDNLATAIHMGVEALFWFHPLVWWLGARLMEERERACDEEVLLMGSEPQAYAEGILKVCELYLDSPLPCVSGVMGANLRKRIEEIMSNRIGLRLSFARKVTLAAAGAAAVAAPILVGILNAPAIQAQFSATATPKFEVASIKPCNVEPGRKRGGGDASPGRLTTGCDLLVDDNNLGLIQRAYVRFSGGHTNSLGVLAIKGGPKWIHSEMYRIDAKADGRSTKEMMQGPMLQALLEDRFKLKIHREIREGPVYALTAVNETFKLKPFNEGSCIQTPLTIPVPVPPPGQRYCKALISFLPSISAEGSTLIEFSKLLSLVLDRPVIDRTGITDRFDIHLEFARDDSTPGLRGPVPDTPAAAASDPSKPTIFTAIREQLGLKLTPARGPIEFLVIDHIERPSEN
jgi:uncharacterized protein (TIGR03435 family)